MGIPAARRENVLDCYHRREEAQGFGLYFWKDVKIYVILRVLRDLLMA